MRELEAGRTVDVAPIPTNPQREARLLPIRIPINKGVLGWRLGLIRKGSQSQFNDVRGLQDLSRLRLAQGQDWPDTQIPEANGIKVIGAPSYEGLFRCLLTPVLSWLRERGRAS